MSTALSTTLNFIGFLDKIEGCDLDTKARERLFLGLEREGKGTLFKDVLRRLARMYYKVIGDTVMTDQLSIKDSKPVRRLEFGEMLEAQEGPLDEDTIGVRRVHVIALSDGHKGWASVAGNNGTVYLEEGDGLARVGARQLALTISEAESSETVCQLLPGSLLEVLQWDTVDDESGSTRLKVKVQAEATIGWITKNQKESTDYFVEFL